MNKEYQTKITLKKRAILFDNNQFSKMETGAYYWNTLAGALSVIGCATDIKEDDKDFPSLVVKLNEATFYFQPVSDVEHLVCYDLTGNPSLKEYGLIRGAIKKFNDAKNEDLSNLRKRFKKLLRYLVDYPGAKVTKQVGSIHFLFTSTDNQVTMLASESTEYHKDQIGYKILDLNPFSFVWLGSNRNPTLDQLALFIYSSVTKYQIGKELDITI